MRLLMALLLVAAGTTLHAEDWSTITNSGNYYYGIGHGATIDEASQRALSDLMSQIATYVQSDYHQTITHTQQGNDVTDVVHAQHCLNTFTYGKLTKVETWTVRDKPGDCEVRRYMLRTELDKIYQARVDRALDMLQQAEEAIAMRDLYYGLYYYYWAYSLVMTVQHPANVRDSRGNVLINYLPMQMERVMSDVAFFVERCEGTDVDLGVTYQGQPVSSLAFTYNDGNSSVSEGRAKDGHGYMEMADGYSPEYYHINIDYVNRSQANPDPEMRSVLEAVPMRPLRSAAFTVKAATGPAATGDPVAQRIQGYQNGHNANGSNSMQTPPPAPWQQGAPGGPGGQAAPGGLAVPGGPDAPGGPGAPDVNRPGIHLQPSMSQLAANTEACERVMREVISAIRSRQYTAVTGHFTYRGLKAYSDLISYGSGRVLGEPEIHYFRSAKGTIVARGMQMSFSFKRGTKTTFVEDVVFTFNAEGKIDAVCFGLGQVAENDILCRQGSAWTDEVREYIMEFMEKYKTAYCLKDMPYIENVFADDARIIVGNLAPAGNNASTDALRVSLAGQQRITYNRYTKDEYLRNLRRAFASNEFINIGFSHNEVQFLNKISGRECFAINIAQEYNSSRYADKGYLFLIVDMTDHDAPLIKVRTWQPNEVPLDQLYGAGDFFE